MPSDENSTVHGPPRPINESQTIPIKLRKQLGYKQHYQFYNDNPKKVLDTAKYHIDTRELFDTERIKVQYAWVNGITSQSSTCEQWSEFVQNPKTSSADVQTNEIVTNCQSHIFTVNVHNPDREKDNNDGWCEVDQRPSGVTDTLFRKPDVTDNMLPNVHVYC